MGRLLICRLQVRVLPGAQTCRSEARARGRACLVAIPELETERLQVRAPRGSGAAAPYGALRAIDSSARPRLICVGTPGQLPVRSADGWPCFSVVAMGDGPSRGQVGAPAAQRGRTSLTPVRAVAASFTEKQGWVSAPGSPSRVLGAGQRWCVRASAQPYLGARTRHRAGPATRCWIGDWVCAATQSLEAAGGKAVAAGAVRA